MARGTDNLLDAELPIDEVQLVETLCRHIREINEEEVIDILCRLPDNISAIDNDRKRLLLSEKFDIECPSFNKETLNHIRKMVKDNWVEVDQSIDELSNEQILMTLIKAIPKISNDELCDIVTIRSKNIACIKDNNRRENMSHRHNLNTIPRFAGGSGGSYQRLREHIRNIRHKQTKIMDSISVSSNENSEFVMFGKIEGQAFERITLKEPFEQLNHIFGENVCNGEVGIPIGLVSVLAGDPGIGKTRICTAICGHISKPLEDEGLGLGVIYFQNEMPTGQFKELNKSVVDNSCMMICSDAHTYSRQEFDIKKASRLFRENGTHLGLAVIDSINMVQECRHSAGMRLVIGRYQRLCKEIGCHVIFVSHLNKQGQVKGSNDLEYLVDQVFKARSMPGRDRFSISCPSKNRAGRTGLSVPCIHTPEGVKIEKIGKGHNRARNNLNGLDGLNALGELGNPINALRNTTNNGDRGADRGAETQTMTIDHNHR